MVSDGGNAKSNANLRIIQIGRHLIDVPFSPDEIREPRGLTVGTASSRSKPDLHQVGHDIYDALTNPKKFQPRRRSRKKQTDLSTIHKDRMYSPTEIATILSISYDTAWRLMPKMKGYKNIAPLGRGKRKALPRVPGWSLLKYLGHPLQ